MDKDKAQTDYKSDAERLMAFYDSTVVPICYDAKASYDFAKLLKRRFPAGEAVIATDPCLAYRYAKEIIGGRWPEAEKTISSSPAWSVDYALYIVKGRWLTAEEAILRDAYWANLYVRDVVQGKWPEAEVALVNEPEFSMRYACYVTGERWPEAEAAIIKSAWKYSYLTKFPEAKEDWAMNGWIDWLET
jgi:hypothetical protein